MPFVRYLDEDGELVGGEQPMSNDLALEGYTVMLKGRRFDERCVSLQRQGRMVTLAPGIGQEAATVGAALRVSVGGAAATGAAQNAATIEIEISFFIFGSLLLRSPR